MSLDANKDLVRRFYAELINEQNLDAIGEPLSEDFVPTASRADRTGSAGRRRRS